MTQELEQQRQGLKARLSELVVAEKVFIKIQGLNEQADKARAEIGGLEDDNTADKESLSELENQRAELIRNPLLEMQKSMDSVMPAGKSAIIEITEDNEVRFGILSTSDGKAVFSPHAGLSGSEQVMFDQALTFALMQNSDHVILCYEAAEIDDDGLVELIKSLHGQDKAQLIVNSCHKPEGFKVGKEWSVSKL